MSDLRPGTTMYRIAELERMTRELRGDARELRGRLATAERRIRELEGQTPQARQLQIEADLAAADLAASGYVEGLSTECRDRWHDRCPPGVHCDCECHIDDNWPEPADYDPGPEIDDEGGMSEYRHPLPADPWEATS